MRMAMALAGAVLALAGLAAGPGAAQDGGAVRAETALHPAVAEARAFMAAYRDDLLAGDRAALAARYAEGGSYVVSGSRSLFSTRAETAALYASPQWQPPEAFTWNGLAYEPLSADAVVVTGSFTWDPKGDAAPVTVAYTALLRRDGDGVLRIRLEHE